MKRDWSGILEVNMPAEAETEEEAKKAMAEKLINELRSGEAEFIVWEDR